MQTERQLVPLADGGDLDVLTVGPEDGFLVVHARKPGDSCPTARSSARPRNAAAVVMTARPGYGVHPRPGAASPTWPATSAPGPGRPRALGVRVDELLRRRTALARLRRADAGPLPGRRLVASVGPYGVEGLDCLAGSDGDVEEFTLAVRGADTLTPYLEKKAAALGSIKGAESSRPSAA